MVDLVFSCSHRSSLAIIIIAYQRDGALVRVPLVPWCGVGDVDRRKVVLVSAKFLSIYELFENFNTFRPLVT